MEIVKSNPKNWKVTSGFSLETPEGLILDDVQQKYLCKFYGVPATLMNVDRKYGTDTLLQVIKVATPDVSILADEKPQVLDPKSNFYSDEEFDEVADKVKNLTKTEGKVTVSGHSKKITLELPVVDTDSFVDDAYKRFITVERLREGGMHLSTSLLRLVCTNGAMVPDKQYNHTLRKGTIDDSLLAAFSDAAGNLNIKQYLNALFYKDGVPLEASVAHYRGMRKTLEEISDNSIAELLFPMDYLEDFYNAQNIDISKMSMKNLEKLPSGLKFYECFNILSNGAKSAEQNVENLTKVATWVRPSLFTQLKQSDFVLKGTPVVASEVIRHRMGDI